MTRPALNVYMYGLFLIFGVGIPFVAFPHTALGVFGLVADDEVWVRLAGMLMIVMGGFYVMAVREDLTRFYPWTVPARYLTAVFHVAMVALKYVGPQLLIFAAVDAATASLTLFWLRRTARETAASEPAA